MRIFFFLNQLMNGPTKVLHNGTTLCRELCILTKYIHISLLFVL